ncbi:hypothetical protein V8C34DRAFT_294153 [Trichoderma compactum]
MHALDKHSMSSGQGEKSRITGLHSEGVPPLEDHPTSRYADGLDGDAVQHQNPPNSPIESIENLAGIDDNETSSPRQVFPPRRQDADSEQSSILTIEQRRVELSQWPAEPTRFLTALGVQSDLGTSSATPSSSQRDSLWEVRGQRSQLNHSFPAVAEEESSSLREAANNVMRQLDRETESSERSLGPRSPDSFALLPPQRTQKSRESLMEPQISMGTPVNVEYETWSGGGASQNLWQQDGYREKPYPQLSKYVKRMEKRTQIMHRQNSSIPAAVNFNDNDDDNDKPSLRSPKGHLSFAKSTAGELVSMDKRTRGRKSPYDITKGIERTNTANTTQKDTSSGNQSNISFSTQSTNRTIWSGVSAGGYSATSRYSMRSNKGDQLGSPFTTVPNHISHTNNYVEGESGSVFFGPISQIGIHEDRGFVLRNPPEHDIFEEIIDSRRMQIASQNGSIPLTYTRPSQNARKKAATRQLLDITDKGDMIQSPFVQETEDAMKFQTLYPRERSIIGTKRTQLYILHFADHLYGRLQEQQQFTEDSPDVITRLLPELLVAFALKLGQTSQSQIKRDAMFFIYTHRKPVIRLTKSLFNSNAVSLEKLLIGNLDAEAEDEFLAEDLVQYLDVVTKDPAFEWLVGKLGTELNPTGVDSSAMKLISSYIQDRLPPIRNISRHNPSKPYKVTFHVECDIPGFIQEQAYEGSAAEVLPKVITLTGSVQDVQATTCEQYLVQTWPVVGCNLLRTIQGALRAENASEPFQFSCKCKFEDRTEIKVSLGRYMEIEVLGTIHSITEIGEQIGWLATTFRSPLQDSEISFCHPEIISFRANDGAESQSIENEFERSFVCRMNVAPDEIRVNLPGSNGQCWQQIFNNPVVVTGYPIKPRTDLIAGVGLELPFDMMTTLADARYLTTFEDRTLVKGFSTALIPTAIHGSIILWHLLVNESGARISYRDPRIEQGILIEPGNLKGARHILGWCMNAQNNIGSLNASYDITWSGLSRGRAALTCEGVEVSVGAGNYFKVGTSFKRGKRDRSICSFVSDGYVSLVEHIGQHHVVLYDVNEKRACLSDGLPVLLHLVRTSLIRDEKEDPECLYTNHIEKLNEPPSPVQGTIAAKAVLFNSENRLSSLRLTDTKVTEQIIERIVDGKTVKEIVRIKEATYYRFENRVEEICLLLEKTIDQTTKAIKEGILRSTPKNVLSGFDFVGVASRSKLRHITTKIPVPAHSCGWTDLVDSLEAITLFGNNFGQLIKPRVDDPPNPCDRCGYETSLPSGKNRLAVCVSVLENIIEMNGNKDKTGCRLTDDIYWHLNEPAFRLCCTNLNGQRINSHTSNWIQILSSKDIRHYPDYLIPTNAVANGAVIFGHGRPRLVSMSHNIRADKKDPLPDKLTQSTTALEISVSSVVQDESSETSETQLFDSVSSATRYSASSKTNGSGLDNNRNVSGTTNPTTPVTSSSLTSDELILSNTVADQQSPVPGIVSNPPEIISETIAVSQIPSNTLLAPFPQNSFGKIMGICSRTLKKLKPRKNSRTESK